MKTSYMLQANFLIVLFFLFLTYLGELEAQDTTWPQFRGLNSSGLADDGAKPPVQFGPNQNFLWKVALPVGHSSPCIWDDNIFLTGYIKDKKELQTICINRNTGNVKWRQTIYPEKIEEYHAISNAATATPTTDGVRVYVYFGSYGVLCYDMSGALVWEKKIPIADIWYGASSSPIATKDILLLSHDFQDNSYLLALDKATGDSVWKVLLPEVHKQHYNTTSYSTPLVMNNQVILHRVQEISGYSIKDGSRLWWLPTPTSGFSTPIFYQNTLYIGTWQEFGEKERLGDLPDFETMVSINDNNGDSLITKEEIPDDMLLISRPEMEEATVYVKGVFGMFDKNEDRTIDREEWDKTIEWFVTFYGESGLMALRPNAHGELPMSQVLWKVKEKVPEVPTPIYYKGYVYMIKNGGIITCVNAESGKVLYRERLGASGPYLASPIVANGNIYISSSKGVITVIKAGDKLEILAQNDLGEKIFSTPAVIGNALYVRTTENLYAFGE
ncbi:MAG: PQQ-binding-like beta-propeller repeat protein [Bacteroidetes bacterium]|nr:PQQ-binding-like beta-propeller repeat protein [Bacteroidota bacterium]